MIVIDVAQRAAARRYDFQPGYGRRTDTDKPGKTWRQENDGPAPDRLARSDARRAALAKKVQGCAEPHQSRSEGFERNVSAALKAMAAGNSILPEIAPLIGVGTERTRDFCYALIARGLAWKRLERREKNRSYTAFYLTDAGQALLTGAEP